MLQSKHRDERLLALGIRARIVAAAHDDLDRGRTSSSRYDAFISYSRAVDGKLAPALQTALQRFAKPWYRMRAVRVFRDDASLSANPALWSSIEEALDESRYFVLLASPEAADSPWVQKEVEFWRDHKPNDRLLIALSDGAIHWDEGSGDFDWERTALPSTIRGVFSDEPRYTDFRWARREEQLTLDDPRFRNDVADIAAPLHGRPKDEILGDDVRQHRRTVRVAISAIVLLAGLAAAAGGAALFAVNQRNEARAERDLATSRYLAAQALSGLDTDVPRALLLSLEALQFEDTAEGRGVLLSALQRQSPELVAFLQPHEATVTTIAFSRDGKTLASGSEDQTVIVSDVESGKRVAVLSPPLDVGDSAYEVSAVALSRDGTRLASGGNDGTILLWDLERRRRQPVRVGKHEGGITSLRFSADGKSVVSFGNGTLRRWDAARRRSVATRRTVDDRVDAPVALSPDGSALVSSGGWDGTVSFWDTQRGRRLTARLPGHGGLIESFAFSSDGTMVASAGWDGNVILWDVERRRRVARLRAHPELALSVAFSRDGTRLASGGSEGTITVWNVARGRRLAVLEGHRKGVVRIAFGVDGSLASASEDGAVMLWDVERRWRLATPLGSHDEGVGSVAFSPDGTTLASASEDETIMLTGLDRRQPTTARLRSSRGRLFSLAFSPDGTTLASATEGSTIVLWDVARRRSLAALKGERGSAHVLAFSHDGRKLVAGGMDELGNGTLSVWDVKRRNLAKVLLDHRILFQRIGSVAFSPNGDTLASGTDGGTIILWNLETGRGVAALTGHRAAVGSVAFSPDGRTLASGSEDETVVLWDVERGTSLATLRGHNDRVLTVAYSPDGKTLASSGEDGLVRLWDVARRQALPTSLRGDSRGVRSLAFSRDGTSLATAGWDGAVLLWDMRLGSWTRRACEIANRNLSRAEWDQFIGSSRRYHRSCPNFPAGGANE